MQGKNNNAGGVRVACATFSNLSLPKSWVLGLAHSSKIRPLKNNYSGPPKTTEVVEKLLYESLSAAAPR